MRLGRAFWGVEQFSDVLRSWVLEANRPCRLREVTRGVGFVAGLPVGVGYGADCVAQVSQGRFRVGLAECGQDAVPDRATSAGTVTVEAGCEAGGADGTVGSLLLAQLDDAGRRVRHDRYGRVEPEP